MAKELTMYQCTLCQQIYSDRRDAEDCEASHYRAVRIVGADYSKDNATGYPESVGIEFGHGTTLRYDYAGGKWWRPKEDAKVLRAVEQTVEAVDRVEQMEQIDRAIDLADGPAVKHCGDCEKFFENEAGSFCDGNEFHSTFHVDSGDKACNNFVRGKAYWENRKCEECNLFIGHLNRCNYDSSETFAGTGACAHFERK